MALCIMRPAPKEFEDFWEIEAKKVKEELKKEEYEEVQQKTPIVAEVPRLYM